MGMDKSMIDYNGKPQRYYLFDLLKELCDEVYISCSKEQYADIPPSFNPLPDDPKLGDIGPMAGLLTAFDKVPDASLVVVGCDYPLLEKGMLEDLIKEFESHNSSVVYYNSSTKFIDPLLAVYHNNIISSLYKSFQLSEYSIRRVLEEVKAVKLTTPYPEKLSSVDTNEEYQDIISKLK